MDIKLLRELNRKEKTSPYLQKIEKNFYDELAALMREVYIKREDCSEEELPKFLAELENLRNIIIELYEAREKKIVSNALYYVRTGEKIELENLSKEEEKFLKKIVEIIKSHRENILDKTLKGKIEDEKESKEEKKTEIPTITVRILKDLPPIVGIDGKIYGEFKVEDIVTLPKPNAEVLIRQGVAQRINTR
ncbi:MAG: hypothetical protein DRN95_01305 [Candidatus Hydrothermarchaeota archaeon]|nr:MAG: hypothetical protein DRN95_01305 [Candidatus Hydrothermarchaeota archaeon]